MILPPDELFQEALCFGGQISNKPMEKLREFTSDVWAGRPVALEQDALRDLLF